MATGLRIEDRLDGAVNFSPWKARIVLILQDSELSDIVKNTRANPVNYQTSVTKPWVVSVESVVSREHMPSWDHLWDDFI